MCCGLADLNPLFSDDSGRNLCLSSPISFSQNCSFDLSWNHSGLGTRNEGLRSINKGDGP